MPRWIQDKGWEDGKTRYLFTEQNLRLLMIGTTSVGVLCGLWIGFWLGALSH
jgi:hypothetical protein